MTAARLLLLRHPEVAAQWHGRCYGQADAGLSRAGIAAAHRIAIALATTPLDAVFASPLRRARLPGARIAAAVNLPLHIDRRLAERGFGSWEGRTWNALWAETGNAMDGMIDAPDRFRPGGGETTMALARRVRDWFLALPPTTVVAVTHGGPICALAGSLRNERVCEWLRFVPRCGTGLDIMPEADGWTIARWPPDVVGT